MPADQLGADPIHHLREVEATILGREMRMEDDLEEEIPELLRHMFIGGIDRFLIAPVSECLDQRLERLEGLIGLFEEMPGERAMGLLLIPWALGAQASHQVDQILGGRPDGPQLRDQHAGEVVGIPKAIEIVNVDGDDVLIIEAEVVQDHCGRPGGQQIGVDRELDVREHFGRVALGEDDRTRTAQSIADAQRIDDPQFGRHRIEAELSDDQIEERQRRDHHELDVRASPQDLDGPLCHKGRTRNAVDDGSRCIGPSKEVLDDRAVNLLEGGGPLIEMVVGVEISQRCCSRVLGGPQHRVPRPLRQESARQRSELVLIGRSEANDRDPGSGHRSAAGVRRRA